ncbi:MAG: hypothetical protein AAF515_21005 [Pseudomonadota bacterium]
MSEIRTISDVEFGEELPIYTPDTSLDAVRPFAIAIGWSTGRGGRFDDHDAARREGLPGALVPGIMAMGFLTTVIHRWSPAARVDKIDTVFRAPLIADEIAHVGAVVTDIDEDTGEAELDLTVKNDRDETRVFGTARISLPLS